MIDAPTLFDVFISYKSEDEQYAQLLFESLTAQGLRVFFSRESLPRLGSDEYHAQIDRAIEQSRHMVVVSSSRDHTISRWVQYEWRLFMGEQLAGRKNGNLVTVVAADLTIADLPIGLRHREVIRFGLDAAGSLLKYLQAASPRHSSVEAVQAAPRSVDRSVFRLAATLGGPPQATMMRPTAGETGFVTAGVDGAIRVYEIDTHVRRLVLGSSRYWSARHEGRATALAVSPDDQHVAAGYIDGAVHIWRLADGVHLGEMKHQSAIGGLVFSPDSRELVSGSRDGAVRFWAVADLDGSGRPSGATTKPAPVVRLSYLPRSSWLLTGLVNAVAGRHALQIEQPSASGRSLLATVDLGKPFRCVSVSGDEAVLAVGGYDGFVRTFDWAAVVDAVRNGQNPRFAPGMGEFKAHSTAITDIAVLPDGASLATCAADPAVMIWDVATLAPKLRLEGDPDDRVISIAGIRSGSTILSALADGRVRVWTAS